MDETLEELEREGMVSCFAWGRRCAAGSFWAYAACAAIRAGSCTRARQGVGAGTAQGSFTAPAFPRVKHESAAVEESLSVQQGLCAQVFSAEQSEGESRDKAS